MTLTIDSAPCDIAIGTCFDTGYNADKLCSPESARTGRSVKLLLPHTAANDPVFESVSLFNAAPHTALLTHDGALLYAGTARLLSISREGYTVEIRGDGAQWAKNAALNAFCDIPLSFTGRLTSNDIRVGWSDSRPVKFLPIVRDSYNRQNSSEDLQTTIHIPSPDDYHPFLEVSALTQAIFTQAGYTIESRFMQSDLFRSLYLSGAYASRDTAAVERRMGFCAVRLTTVEAEADSVGRVYATPFGAGNNLGNIVETATSLSTDENGIARTEPYNNGNCFGVENSKIVYRPRSVIQAGFEYRLRYTTAHRILTRDQLKGFDSVNFGTGGTISLLLPNRYADRRNSITAWTTYRVVVFAAAASTQFRLLYTLNGNTNTLWADFSGRSALVTTPSSGAVSSPSLFVRNGNVWTTYPNDWALYDGHIGETGQSTAEICVRTPAETLGPSVPKYFNAIFFSGAEEGMRFTLHTQCSLHPHFSPAPGYGVRITIKDVACHNIRQQVFLNALQHLFNLRFITDEPLKKVFIEPDPDFWNESRKADWRGRTDFGKNVVWEDAAIEAHDSRSYGYRTGDGATARLTDEEGTPFGAWQTETGSFACMTGDEKRISPFFSPTLSIAGTHASAPSALLMQVGDRDDASDNGVNFAPRIVRYSGLKPLPTGEYWENSPSQTTYPFAAFHFEGDRNQNGFTLCFGDRDKQTGLHRFYDREEQILNSRQHVTLTLRLEPHEFESLFTLDSGVPDLRWVFLLSTDRGDVLTTLRKIGKYDPENSAARCTFTLLSHDQR